MTGIDRSTDRIASDSAQEFPPVLDLVPVLVGTLGLIAAGVDAAPGGGSDTVVALLRTLVGAAFLGVVTDASLTMSQIG